MCSTNFLKFVFHHQYCTSQAITTTHLKESLEFIGQVLWRTGLLIRSFITTCRSELAVRLWPIANYGYGTYAPSMPLQIHPFLAFEDPSWQLERLLTKGLEHSGTETEVALQPSSLSSFLVTSLFISSSARTEDYICAGNWLLQRVSIFKHVPYKITLF